VPILTSVDHVEIPGGVLRPIVDPVPLYAWSLAWRRDDDRVAISVIRAAAEEVATADDWLRDPNEAGSATWLPEPERSRLSVRSM
jgi:hypothetical protein